MNEEQLVKPTAAELNHLRGIQQPADNPQEVEEHNTDDDAFFGVANHEEVPANQDFNRNTPSTTDLEPMMDWNGYLNHYNSFAPNLMLKSHMDNNQFDGMFETYKSIIFHRTKTTTLKKFVDDYLRENQYIAQLSNSLKIRMEKEIDHVLDSNPPLEHEDNPEAAMRKNIFLKIRLAFVNKIQLSEELIHQFEAFGKLLIDPKKYTITNFIPTGERPLFDTKNKRVAVCSTQRNFAPMIQSELFGQKADKPVHTISHRAPQTLSNRKTLRPKEVRNEYLKTVKVEGAPNYVCSSTSQASEYPSVQLYLFQHALFTFLSKLNCGSLDFKSFIEELKTKLATRKCELENKLIRAKDVRDKFASIIIEASSKRKPAQAHNAHIVIDRNADVQMTNEVASTVDAEQFFQNFKECVSLFSLFHSNMFRNLETVIDRERTSSKEMVNHTKYNKINA
ncbi:unnamed protein product [Caenorhabditis brenneri]